MGDEYVTNPIFPGRRKWISRLGRRTESGERRIIDERAAGGKGVLHRPENDRDTAWHGAGRTQKRSATIRSIAGKG